MSGCLGYHGQQRDTRWTGPSKFAYWRVLSDLDVGVSMLALYGNDLTVATDGVKPGHPEASDYQREFGNIFKMAAQYAGFHASPQVSPGAWVAFRHVQKNLATGNELKNFTDNYSFLMHQILPDSSVWQDLINISPEIQRFGAWAKAINAANKIQVGMNELFAASLKGKASVVRIIYYGSTGTFESSFGNQKVNTKLTGTNTWKTLEISVAQSNYTKDEHGAHITVKSLAGNILFHMINVERGDGLPEDVTDLAVVQKQNELVLTWKLPMQYDLDKVALFNGNQLLTAVSAAYGGMVITLPDMLSRKELRLKTIDESGRSSPGKPIQ